MKKSIFAAVIFIQLFSLFAATNPDKAARDGINHFLKNITSEQLSNFGLNNSTELTQVKIEPGFRLVSLSESMITQWNSKQSYNNLFHSDSLHLYPLSVNGKYKCMLAVDFTKGEWKAVSIGYRDLSVKMESIRNTWAGKDIKIVRVFPLQRYYFTVMEAAQPNCTQISFDKALAADARESFMQLTPLAEAMLEMQTEIAHMSRGGNHEN